MSAVPAGAPAVTRVTESVLPTRHGVFRIVGFRGADGTELVSLSQGIVDHRHPSPAPLVRVHSECLTGDTLGSRRCDCGEQLDAALARIAREGEGVLVYVRGHEGRGIGLLEKLRAYRLQDQGWDTVDANLRLGHPADARDYGQAAAILQDLGLSTIRLLSSNPAKEQALAALGITVAERVSLFVASRPENEGYLSTKRARMRHDAPDTDGARLWLRWAVESSESAAELDHRYGWLASQDEWVIAQSAQSLDGFLATRSGDGAGLSGEADLRHLHRLRALADAVVVGAQTVVNDDPRLSVRLVSGTDPVRVILDGSGRVRRESQVFGNGAGTLWFTGPDAADAPAGVEQVRLGSGPWASDEIVGALRERGLRRLLVEGGGRTVSSFLAAGALDRLFVTVVPVLLGDGVPGVRLPAVDRVGDAPRWPVRRFAFGDDTCLEITPR